MSKYGPGNGGGYDDRRRDDRDSRYGDSRDNRDRYSDSRDRRSDDRDRYSDSRGHRSDDRDRYGDNRDRRSDDRDRPQEYRVDDRRADDGRYDDRRSDNRDRYNDNRDRRSDDRDRPQEYRVDDRRADGGRYGDNRDRRSDDRDRYGNRDRGSSGSGGGRGGGFGGGRGGRGGGGPNAHMGTDSDVLNLLNSAEMGDANLMKILFLQSNDRSEIMQNVANVELPRLESSDWRYQSQIGAVLPFNGKPGDPTVIANHYKLAPTDLPDTITQYDITINTMYKLRGSDEYLIDETREDIAAKGDRDLMTEIIQKVCNLNKSWEKDESGNPIGFTYDGRKSLFVSSKLIFPSDDNEFTCEVRLAERTYFVTIKYASEINPVKYTNSWNKVDAVLLRALDSGLSSFARWMTDVKQKTWFLNGTKLYKLDPQNVYELDRAIVAMRGYYAALKCCLTGTCLVLDISVSAFLRGGPLMEIMLFISMGRFRTVNEMYGQLKDRGDPRFLDEVAKQMKGAKVRVIHLNYSKKFKGFGPKCSDTLFAYTDENGTTTKITVAQYFQLKYPGLVKYPDFPCVNIGSEKKPRMIPLELIDVAPGQCRQKDSQNVKLVAQLIKYAAIRPNERAKLLTDGCEDRNGVIDMMQADKNSKAFGLTKESLSSKPLEIRTKLLPPAKIQYGENRTLSPDLKGSWDLKGNYKFYQPGSGKKAKIQVIQLGGYMQKQPIQNFLSRLVQDALRLGLILDISTGSWLCVENPRNADDINKKIDKMIDEGVDMVFCILNGNFNDWYRIVKQFTDSKNLVSQCFKYPNIERPKPGYNENVLLKINTKLGGVNHTLASRSSDLGKRGRDDNDKHEPEQVFQDPPNSISWIFDAPTMLLGIDINHPEPGSMQPSVASLVASMDGRLAEYAANVSCQTSNSETFNYLSEATENLVKTFYRKNNCYPKKIIIFRDGVSEGQFKQLEGEIKSIKEGLESCGFDIGLKGASSCPIAMIVCQKRHNTRFFFKDKNGQYLNPCPGLCSDAIGGEHSISSAEYNEFYLNSHVSIQGTSKPCKYTLTYDEIGLQMSEIETLAYWSSYLYCRANKSVSVAQPCYYAHWAAKRGRILLSSGVPKEKLGDIFQSWNEREGTSMFFI